MGTSYDANAGYGVKITEEMCEKISPYNEAEFDGEDIDDFMYAVLKDSPLDTTVTGNCMWDEPLDVWIMMEDPLNEDMNKFIEELNKLPFNFNFKSVKDLTWICEIWVG